MLVARRDPFHPGAQDASRPPHGHRAPRSARFMLALQVAGSALAIPVGLASAYSLYRANFSVETACQGLRANIISMIDKKIDAGTRRMLVRRDVEAFEATCGGFDPDAEAAFKTLLASEPESVAAPVAVVSAPVAAVAPVEAPAKAPVLKTEPRPAAAAKKATPPAATAEPAQRDVATSDARWLDAVREALVNHERQPAEAAAVARAPKPLGVIVRPAATGDAPALVPALPPAQAVASPAQPVPAAARDHPVPPASIPGADAAPADVAKADAGGNSRFGWMAKVPILGPALNN